MQKSEEVKLWKRFYQVTWNSNTYIADQVKKVLNHGYPFQSKLVRHGIIKIIDGHHLICQNKTRDGKAALYTVGLLSNVIWYGSYTKHQCILLTTTREYAMLIKDRITNFSMYTQPAIRTGCFTGGFPIENDCQYLENPSTSPHIIVGTPGRIFELCLMGVIKTQNVRHFAIDQCDILVKHGQDMFFKVKSILEKLNKWTQLILISAFFTEQKLNICREWCQQCSEKLTAEISLDEYPILAPENFFQVVKSKKEELKHLLKQKYSSSRAIVFLNTVFKAQSLTNFLSLSGIQHSCLISVLKQTDRNKQLQKFMSGKSRILIATNLVGRDLLILNVNLIINYDIPKTIDQFVHRAGTTRLSPKVRTITLIKNCADERNLIRSFEKELNDSIEECQSKY